MNGMEIHDMKDTKNKLKRKFKKTKKLQINPCSLQMGAGGFMGWMYSYRCCQGGSLAQWSPGRMMAPETAAGPGAGPLISRVNLRCVNVW